MSEEGSADVTALTVQLLSAYLSNNTVASADLAGLIATTREALAATGPASVEPVEETFEPAVSLRKSLSSPDHILSMIDGKPYKTLKRHLSKHGLTPEEYRARYGLPATYPMVAPSYSEHRRDVAQRLGLGRKSTKADDVVAAPKRARKAKDEAVAEPVEKAPRGRRKAAGAQDTAAD